MAYFWELGAECGHDPEGALAFARHFVGCRWVLSDGFETHVGDDDAGAADGEGGTSWALVFPTGMSRSGGAGDEIEARRMTEVGVRLYDRLRSAPPFRFAAVGVEVHDFNTAEGVRDMAAAGHPLVGLVISEDLYERSGRPARFVPFAQGYWWEPYEGERYWTAEGHRIYPVNLVVDVG